MEGDGCVTLTHASVTAGGGEGGDAIELNFRICVCGFRVFGRERDVTAARYGSGNGVEILGDNNCMMSPSEQRPISIGKSKEE